MLVLHLTPGHVHFSERSTDILDHLFGINSHSIAGGAEPSKWHPSLGQLGGTEDEIQVCVSDSQVSDTTHLGDVWLHIILTHVKPSSFHSGDSDDC